MLPVSMRTLTCMSAPVSGLTIQAVTIMMKALSRPAYSESSLRLSQLLPSFFTTLSQCRVEWCLDLHVSHLNLDLHSARE